MQGMAADQQIVGPDRLAQSAQGCSLLSVQGGSLCGPILHNHHLQKTIQGLLICLPASRCRQVDAELKFGHHHGRDANLFGGYRLQPFPDARHSTGDDMNTGIGIEHVVDHQPNASSPIG